MFFFFSITRTGWKLFKISDFLHIRIDKEESILPDLDTPGFETVLPTVLDHTSIRVRPTPPVFRYEYGEEYGSKYWSIGIQECRFPPSK